MFNQQTYLKIFIVLFEEIIEWYIIIPERRGIYMPLVNSKEMFEKAYNGGYAIGAFNCNNMEIVQAITEAAKECNSPVILQVSAGARK